MLSHLISSDFIYISFEYVHREATQLAVAATNQNEVRCTVPLQRFWLLRGTGLVQL